MVEQMGGIAVIEDKIGMQKRVLSGNGTGSEACFDIGMGFVEDDCLWIAAAGFGKQRKIGADRACAQLDRGVVFDLTGDKDTVA
jgi:hypothetical protein